MHKRRKLLLLLAGVMVLSGGLLWLTREPERSYAGRPLSTWLVQLASLSWSDARAEVARYQATADVRHFDADAIPLLVQYASYTPSRLTMNWYYLKRKLGLHMQGQPMRNLRRADGAFRVLAALGPAAEKAIPDLTRWAEDLGDDGRQDPRGRRDRANKATITLGFLGPKALPSLLTTLTNQARLIRERSLDSLGMLGTNARPAVPDLVKLLPDQDQGMREAASNALRQIAPEVLTKIERLRKGDSDGAPRQTITVGDFTISFSSRTGDQLEDVTISRSEESERLEAARGRIVEDDESILVHLYDGQSTNWVSGAVSRGDFTFRVYKQ